MKKRVLKVHPNDNVLVALQNLAQGEKVTDGADEYILKEAIPAKHKFYSKDLNARDDIIMYGVLVGQAQISLATGS